MSKLGEFSRRHFEVDSTESVWYSHQGYDGVEVLILKLTPQSQYGIFSRSIATR